MQIVIVADVFGNTNALTALAKELNSSAIIDPYQGIEMQFKDEKEAYKYFIEMVGLDNYLLQIIAVIKQYTEPVNLIAFSVGASAIWRLSATSEASLVNNSVCFYGSQIRHFTTIKPLFDIELVFPSSEAHFDVDMLKNKLSTKANVTTSQVPYLHGFMNQCSKNYNSDAYKNQVRRLRAMFTIQNKK